MTKTKETIAAFAFGAFLLIYALINIRWINNYRDGGLFDIDESAYLLMAVKNYYAYLNGGVISWMYSVQSPNAASPLTSALASLLFTITGPRLSSGIYVPLAACIVSIASIYCIARKCGDLSLAVATALLVASAPLLVNYSRSFHFAIPATACTTIALLCLIKSEQAKRWGWLLAFGFFVGLMPLARTMTIAFIPCIGLAAFVYVASSPTERLTRIVRLVVAGMVACATALTWLLWNGKFVAQYLFSFGYGARATEFGPKLSFLSSIAYMIQIYLDQLYAPHFIVVCAGIAAAIFLLAVNVLRADLRGRVWSYAASPITPISIFVLLSFLALSSSQNKGTAFIAPILPATILLATWALYNLGKNTIYRAALFGVLAITATYAFLPMIDLNSNASTRTTHWLPGRGNVVYADGGSTQQGYEAAFGINTTAPGKALPSETAAAWHKLNNDTLDAVTTLIGANRALAFGFRNAVYNVNTIRLTNSLRNQPPFDVAQIEPLVIGEEAGGYLAWLTSGAGKQACVLLTSPGQQAEFSPYINTSLLESAAKQTGFTAGQTLTMPNGRIVTIWTRTCG